MRARNIKGFTLVETLVALALLGILMLMLSSALSVLATSSEQAEDYVTASSGAAYVLKEVQKDLVNDKPYSIDITKTSFTIASASETIVYEMTGSLLRRNSKTLATVISGNFSQEDDFLHVDITLADRSKVDVYFYLDRS